MPESIRRPLAPAAAGLLAIWVLSVSGATGWPPTVNWTLFLVAVALLLVRLVR